MTEEARSLRDDADEPRGRDPVKATLTRLDTLESIPVLWNPERYSVSRRSRVAAARPLGASRSTVQAAVGGEEMFFAELLLDNTRGVAEDLRQIVSRLESWMEPDSGEALPPRVLFAWGGVRFRGVTSALDQSWVLFDRDGTPRRGWLRLVLRR